MQLAFSGQGTSPRILILMSVAADSYQTLDQRDLYSTYDMSLICMNVGWVLSLSACLKKGR